MIKFLEHLSLLFMLLLASLGLMYFCIYYVFPIIIFYPQGIIPTLIR